jgi:hypothetical protein
MKFCIQLINDNKNEKRKTYKGMPPTSSKVCSLARISYISLP